MSRDWATEYSELANRKAEQIAELEAIQRKALAAAEAETVEHYQERKKAETEREEARKAARELLEDVLIPRETPRSHDRREWWLARYPWLADEATR